MLVFEVGNYKENGVNGLVDWVKIAVWTGTWLFVDGIDKMTY
jgi:hypothetical protein